MFCSKGFRTLAIHGRKRCPQLFMNYREICLYNVRDVKATRQILQRSGLYTTQKLLRLSGVRLLHVSQQRGEKQNNEDKDDDDDNRHNFLSILKTLLGVTAVFGTFAILGELGRKEMGENNPGRPPVGGPVGEIQWNSFYKHLLLKGEVQEITIQPQLNKATAILHPGAVYKGQRINTRIVRIIHPEVDTIEAKVREAEAEMGIKATNAVSVRYERSREVSIIALVLMAGLVGLLLSFMFGKGRNTRFTMNNPFSKLTKADFTLIDPMIRKGKGTKFSDVAGLKEPKIEVLEFVDYLKNPGKYLELGAKPPKGAILFGPPGCGKTMLAKAVANEANVPFLSMNGSEFIEMIGGLGASRVRSLFAEARKRAPSIIYIDEIDAIGKQRDGGGPMSGQTGEADQTLNQLLVEMDGMGSTSNVILLASTNRADVLDKALLRPGRFDRHITIDLPSVEERKEILEKHMSRIVLEQDKSKHSPRLATLTPGFSGADLANLVNEAALHAARTLKEKVQTADLEYAIERVTAGPEKKSSVISPMEKKVVAYHESGHALVGWMLEHTDALLKVTIIPRTSAALGFAQYTPKEKKLYNADELMDKMCMALGGRVAESLTFNRITTGAQNDLEKVTKIAYAQIREFGFSDAVGHVSFEQTQGVKPYSKKLQATMDLEAKQLIAAAYKRTEECLLKHQHQLEQLAQLLLEKETLNYDEVEALLGPPPHGQKHLISPLDYETGLKEESKMGEEGQGMGSH